MEYTHINSKLSTCRKERACSAADYLHKKSILLKAFFEKSGIDSV